MSLEEASGSDAAEVTGPPWAVSAFEALAAAALERITVDADAPGEAAAAYLDAKASAPV